MKSSITLVVAFLVAIGYATAGKLPSEYYPDYNGGGPYPAPYNGGGFDYNTYPSDNYYPSPDYNNNNNNNNYFYDNNGNYPCCGGSDNYDTYNYDNYNYYDNNGGNGKPDVYFPAKGGKKGGKAKKFAGKAGKGGKGGKGFPSDYQNNYYPPTY